MATVTIPSPSALLQSPLLPPAACPQKASARSATRKQSTTNRAHKPSTELTTAFTKPKQTKSRDGCKNCKEKRLKCDETKPTCVQCEKKGVICKGYEKVLKWRPQEDTFKNKTGPPRSRRNSTIVKAAPSRPTGLPAAIIDPQGQNHALVDPSPCPSPIQQPSKNLRRPHQTDHLRDTSSSTHTKDDQSHDDIPTCRHPTDFSMSSSPPSLMNSCYDEESAPPSARSTNTSLWLDESPRASQTALPDIDFMITSPDCMDYQCEDPSGLPLLYDSPVKEAIVMNGEEIVEQSASVPDPANSCLVHMPSPTSSHSSDSSSRSWFNRFTSSVWDQPMLRHDSDELLIMRFDKQTCGILSIKDGPSENPWRTMLWPLAREDGALRHAITSLTAFHASKELPGLRIKGMEHMDQSLQLLSRGINSMPLGISLATTLVLAFCESWDMLISTGIRHLRGASHLVGQIMTQYGQCYTLPQTNLRLGFLCRTWVYMDVIARLTSLEGDDSTNFDIVGTLLCEPSSNDCELDPLMGCASTLFPTIGRVANLVRKVRQRNQSNSFQIISQAKELKSMLEKWRPPLIFAAPEDQRTEVEHGLRTAEAYRGASLLYLLQAVPEISYDSVTDTITALADEVLTHIANVPVSSGMVIIQIFPLLAAGCEAVDEESRKFVAGRWQAMIQRMKIQNLDKCLDVVKEVWDRRDHAVAENQRRKERLAAVGTQGQHLSKEAGIRKGDSTSSIPGSPEECGQDIESVVNSPLVVSKPGALRKESSHCCNGLHNELTVRGRQHWAGVMRDFRWEVLIG